MLLWGISMQRLDRTTNDMRTWRGYMGSVWWTTIGEPFVNACAATNIVIGGSAFPHKRIHNATWVSPDQVTEHQIDHIGINKMFRRSLQDVRVKRCADVASDHHLVTARLKLKLRRNDVDQERIKVRYNVDYLKDQNTAQEYKVALGNGYLESIT